MLPLCSPHFLPIRPLPGLLHQPLALLHRPLFLRHARVRVLQRKFMWALRFSLSYAILRMNPDLVPANGTLEFPKPWNQSAVLFLFCAPAGLQVRQLRRRVRVHVFQRKAFLGLAIFRSWGIFTLVVVILTFICYTMKEPWMAYSKRDA